MIDYQTYQRIKHLREQEHLSAMQIASTLQLDYRTVIKWLKATRFHPRQSSARQSLLDPYKDLLLQWLEHHPYTAQQCFQRLREQGYPGGYSILKEYIRKVRPVRKPAFLTLAFAPGECAQVDWGICRARHIPHYPEFLNMPSSEWRCLFKGNIQERTNIFFPAILGIIWQL